MALSASLVWEVRTTGSDLNGGAFRAGASGTDYSQQDSAQLGVSDASAAGGVTLNSATGGFTAAMVGNVVQISGGTLTAGFYEIAAFIDPNTIALDRSPGTGSGSTARVGGALGSLATLAGAMVARNKAFIRAGAYATATGITFAQSVTPSSSSPRSRLIGYGASRTDGGAGGRPTLTLTAGSNVSVLAFTGLGWTADNLIVDGGSRPGSIPIDFQGGASYGEIRNCKAQNFGGFGIIVQGGSGGYHIHRCEVTGGAAGSAAGIYASAGGSWVTHCYVHDSPCTGVRLAINTAAVGNVVANLSGATTDGILAGYGTLVLNNTVTKCGRHGIVAQFNNPIAMYWAGNLVAENGGYGIVASSAGAYAADVRFDGNAFYANAAGARNSMDDATNSATLSNGVAPYANVNDVTLTADPFVAKASSNFALNGAVGGGAACRAAGLPRTWPGLAVAGAPDLGAIQHPDAGGGAAAGGSWIEG